MNLSRREFLQMLALAGATGAGLPACNSKSGEAANLAVGNLYEIPPFGEISLLHFTDCHAQLKPIYFREPSINIGVGDSLGKPPHVVGEALLNTYGIAPQSVYAHAFTHVDFAKAAHQYGKVGGFAYIATLVKSLREQRANRCLLLDGGDSWQGSATSLWTRGQDMVDACKLLGVDMMTGHWEFTYGAERVQEILEKSLKGHIEFLAQNVNESTWGDRVFKPYSLRDLNGVPVAVIGQAYPYTPIANPRYLIPDWNFGIEEAAMQKTVEQARAAGAKVVVILSHNGMDVDLKMASRVTGVDVILGGHTHDAVPAPVIVNNAQGKTLVINSGSHGKYLSVLDLEVKRGRVTDFRYKLLPVFSNLIEPDARMAAYIERVRAPYKTKLEQKLAVTDSLLYRRGNFNGSFDQLIVDALRNVLDTEIAFSPGFRWGTSVLPGDAITFEDVMNQTALTYPAVSVGDMTGAQLKDFLEDIADNLFNKDPYYQLGGDMVRVGGLRYSINPSLDIGQRIDNLEMNGKPVQAQKTYRVARWGGIQPQEGQAIWDVVSEYLRNNYLRKKQPVIINEPNLPKLKGIKDNPGLA